MQKKARPPHEGPETGAEASAPAGRGRRVRRRLGVASLFSFLVAGLVFAVLALALSERTLPVPHFVRAAVEDRLNARLPGAPLRLGRIELGVDRNGIPQLMLYDIRLADRAGGAVAQLNWLGAEISLDRLFRGEFAAETLYLRGAQITLRRTAEGRFMLAAGTALGGEEQPVTDLLAQLDRAMSEGSLSPLSEVVAAGVVITLEDARSGRIWQATNAAATLRRTSDALSLSVTSDVFNGTDDLAGLQLSLIRNRASGNVILGATIRDMPAREIALQSPVLSWLGVIDAPISGAVRTELDENGALEGFAGTLEMAGGALRPLEDVPPVPFNSAKAYFTFDPARERIDFSDISFGSDDGRLSASGHTYLTEFEGLWPRAYVGQFRVEALDYAGGEEFDGPVSLRDIRADLRFRLDPFTVELGQLVLDDAGAPITARGRVTADTDGWHVAIDAMTPRIDSDRVLEYWPRRVSPVTRTWLARSLRGGTLLAPALAIRFDTGSEPEAALSFEFENGAARVLPQMPLLDGARGRAELNDRRFTLSLLEGGMTGSDGGRVDAAGSRFTVPDVRPKPSMGEIDLVAEAPLGTLLRVLDNPPLRLMQRAGRPVDVAQAMTRAEAHVTLPLKDGIMQDEIAYDVTAALSDVSSDALVPGRVLTSPELTLTADPQLIGIDGSARLDGVPLTASWRQPLGPAAAEGSRIRGTVTLSPDSVAAFDLPLPDDMLRGAGSADYVLTIPGDPSAPPRLALTSDLVGLSVGLDALGWRKPARTPGDLVVAATLGEVPAVETLSLDAPGLALDGRLDLAAGGALERARFEELRLGGWLDATVELTPAPNGGPVRVAVVGGTLDLRQLDLGGGQGGSSGPISVRLDRLTVSDGIALAPFTAQIEATPRGLSGDFQARVNGGTAIRGALAPANAGTAIRLTSDDAAGVLRDAGLTPNTRDGRLDLVLTPVSGAPAGTFDGEFLIENLRLKNAPAMASLLDAISIVGLLDQLAGPGIRFDTVDGRFQLDRRQIRLERAAAVGPSMGISADGIYDLQAGRMDFRGVVSPVYFLNAIGSFLTRRGEGLFGFNYRMTGPASAPSVGVNPLSILTPGAFREIFRRAPPGG